MEDNNTENNNIEGSDTENDNTENDNTIFINIDCPNSLDYNVVSSGDCHSFQSLPNYVSFMDEFNPNLFKNTKIDKRLKETSNKLTGLDKIYFLLAIQEAKMGHKEELEELLEILKKEKQDIFSF